MREISIFHSIKTHYICSYLLSHWVALCVVCFFLNRSIAYTRLCTIRYQWIFFFPFIFVNSHFFAQKFLCGGWLWACVSVYNTINLFLYYYIFCLIKTEMIEKKIFRSTDQTTYTVARGEPPRRRHSRKSNAKKRKTRTFHHLNVINYPLFLFTISTIPFTLSCLSSIRFERCATLREGRFR